MHSISNRNFETHIFALLTFREKFQDVTLARKTTSEFPELEARSRKDPGGDLVYVSLS
jgi:hypothetical protein